MDSQANPQGAAGPDASENTPLLPTGEQQHRSKGTRTVTFSPNPVTRTYESEPRSGGGSGHGRLPHQALTTGLQGQSGVPAQPVFAALNSKLRRRNSHSSVPAASGLQMGPKIGPQRSTKKTEKLKLLPNPELDEEEPDEESGRDVYSQYTRIKDPNARRDAARLGKADRDRLPRVTAYCTANRYEMEGLQRFLKGKAKSRGTNAKLIDECIYSPYNYSKATPPSARQRRRPDPVRRYERRHSTGGESTDGLDDEDHRREAIMGDHPDGPQEGYNDRGEVDVGPLHSDALLGPSVIDDDDAPITDSIPDFDITIHTPEVFLFDYGVVVIWGMTEAQEKRFLKDISKFEIEKLSPDDVETEHFNFYYTHEYQARIYNDFITLRDKNNYMTKLAISHALAQSVKVCQPLTVSGSPRSLSRFTTHQDSVLTE